MARHRGNRKLIEEGCVYALQSPRLPKEVFKIGHSNGLAEDRCQEVARKFGLPFEVVRSQATSNVYHLEERVHKELDSHRVRKGDAILQTGKLQNCRELFRGLTLQKVKDAMDRSLDGLSAEDTWCAELPRKPNHVLAELGVMEHAGHEWVSRLVEKLAANGNQAVAEFTLRQLGTGAKFSVGKTFYLSWKFSGKTRAWFDPTQPQCASVLYQRRFDGDADEWHQMLGPERICYKYRGAGRTPELRLILWTAEHMAALDKMIHDVMLRAEFLEQSSVTSGGGQIAAQTSTRIRPASAVDDPR